MQKRAKAPVPKGNDFLYVTTPIYYPNADPHLGHVYTNFMADAVARWGRKVGKDVYFLTGMDEHGEKIDRAAEEQGKTPQDLVDDKAIIFKDAFDELNVSYDRFIRTTDDDHIKTVLKLYAKAEESGDTYFGHYEGYYCVGCERYFTDTQAEKTNRNCDVHTSMELELRALPSYYFKTSKFQKEVRKLFEDGVGFAQPESARQSMIGRLGDELRDLSTSRPFSQTKWGIPMPENEENPDREGHAMFVWFDALTNYLTGAEYLDEGENFKKRWGEDTVHIIGKDITWYHTVIWPAMLASAGLDPPGRVFSHGFLKVKGEKMSKSKGNVFDPMVAAKTYGNDGLRFFLHRTVEFGKDGDFYEEDLITTYNNELADQWGNLVNRTFSLTAKNSGGKVPEYDEKVLDETDKKFIEEHQAFSEVDERIHDLKLTRAMDRIWKNVIDSNRYVNKVAPWKLAKEGETDRLNAVLYNMNEAVRYDATLMWPFLPETSEKVLGAYGLKPRMDTEDMVWGVLEPGTEVPDRMILFNKIEMPENLKDSRAKE